MSLCASPCARCKMGIETHLRVHAIEAGVYTQFTVPDTAGNEFHGFDGHSILQMSGAGGLRIGRVSALGSFRFCAATSIFEKDLSTESASELEKGALLVTMRSGVGYSVPRKRRTELEPSLSYCWAWQRARLELQDRDTQQILRPVYCKHSDRGISLGLAVRIWDLNIDDDRSGTYPRFRLEYSFADVLGGMHILGVEYKFLEHGYSPLHEGTQSFLLVGELALSPPAKYVTVGIGVNIS